MLKLIHLSKHTLKHASIIQAVSRMDHMTVKWVLLFIVDLDSV